VFLSVLMVSIFLQCMDNVDFNGLFYNTMISMHAYTLKRIGNNYSVGLNEYFEAY
jgi:hypothetical protein